MKGKQALLFLLGATSTIVAHARLQQDNQNVRATRISTSTAGENVRWFVLDTHSKVTQLNPVITSDPNVCFIIRFVE